MQVVLTGQCALSILTETGPLLRALKEAGHDATVVAPALDNDTRFALHSLNIRVIEYGSPVTELPVVHDAAELFSLWRTLRILKPDLVLCQGFRQTVAGSLAAWLAGVNRIYAQPGSFASMQKKGPFMRRLRARMNRMLCKLALSTCRTVFFQSPDERAFFRDKGILPAETANKLLNGAGVDLEAYPVAPLPETGEDFEARERLVFLCISPMDKDSGLEEFAEAARQVRQDYPMTRFRLAGTPESGANPLSSSDLSLWKTWMEILPSATHPKQLLEEASVFVLPSCRNGLPHAALAALATGRPVIATDAPGCREVVLDGVNGFSATAGSAASMAETMRRCIREHEELPAMGAASRRYAEERYDARQVCRSQLKAMHLAHAGQEAVLPQTVLGSLLKRGFDLAVNLPAFVLLLPIIALLALRVRSGISKDIFFRQTRPGKAGKLFRILKFKTMTDATDENGKPLPDHERLTPLGSKLRSASLDELPELWNVITGEMSLVGPRPLLPQYLDRYTPRQARRHEVRPGITGWAQVNGRNAASWEERLEMDVWYVDNHSLWLDLKILFLTVWKVFRKEDVSAPGHATCPEFMGTAAATAQTDCAANDEPAAQANGTPSASGDASGLTTEQVSEHVSGPLSEQISELVPEQATGAGAEPAAGQAEQAEHISEHAFEKSPEVRKDGASGND